MKLESKRKKLFTTAAIAVNRLKRLWGGNIETCGLRYVAYS